MQLPELLNIPPKMLPLIQRFNAYEVFLIEGGRGSGKTHSIARFLLYLGDVYTLRIVCGRELQSSIEESVYTVLVDIIRDFDLNYEIQARKITHRLTKTTFTFKGFREQGRVNIKGLEGVDILWIDEAQSITADTLQVIVPTIRKPNSRLMFAMNRFMDDDAVPEYYEGRTDCLRIEINYPDNPFCPAAIKREAEALRENNPREYDHVYMNVPLSAADDILFNFNHLNSSYDIVPFGETSFKHRVIGFDFAARGNDMCIASVLDRVTNQHWEMTEQIAWGHEDSMHSVGKIIEIIGKYNPTASMLDVGGMGTVVWDRLQEVKVNIGRFDGACASSDPKYVNVRADAYYGLADWFEHGFLKINRKDGETIRELKKVRMKFRSNGKRLICDKDEIKKELGRSPDRADSLAIAVYCARTQLGRVTMDSLPRGAPMKRVSRSRRNKQRVMR